MAQIPVAVLDVHKIKARLFRLDRGLDVAVFQVLEVGVGGQGRRGGNSKFFVQERVMVNEEGFPLAVFFWAGESA